METRGIPSFSPTQPKRGMGCVLVTPKLISSSCFALRYQYAINTQFIRNGWVLMAYLKQGNVITQMD